MRFTLILALLLANAAFAAQHVWEPPFYNGVAAEVEKTLITYDDIRREMATISPQIRAQATSQEDYDAKMEQLYQETLRQLVERALIINDFKAKGFKIPQKDVDAQYKAVLKENFNGKVSELVEALRQEGLTLPAYRRRIEEDIMVQAMQGRFRKELPEITPHQIEEFYKANQNKFAQEGSTKLSVITLKPLTDEPADVLVQTANEVLQKVMNGEDFAKLAQDFNQEGTADWGWLKNSDLSEEINKALADVKTGEVSQPVTVDGPKVLLLKVEDRKNEGVVPLSQVSELIKRHLYDEQARAAYAQNIEQLKKKYFVKING